MHTGDLIGFVTQPHIYFRKLGFNPVYKEMDCFIEHVLIAFKPFKTVICIAITRSNLYICGVNGHVFSNMLFSCCQLFSRF